MQGNYWQAANQKLLAKAISELHFENAITVDPLKGDSLGWRYPMQSGCFLAP
ncbi:hypothetical protein [Salinivibrio socompensis]|uniref:hypothetical protein n=1 Tax=Salinivibrio socompensis TaxID=1510206 RepID=UPI0004B1A46F|nr:hypothetical protein [Salinivibrio socompensis]